MQKVVVVTDNCLLQSLELPIDNSLHVQTARPPDFLSRLHSASRTFPYSRLQLVPLSERETTNVSLRYLLGSRIY